MSDSRCTLHAGMHPVLRRFIAGSLGILFLACSEPPSDTDEVRTCLDTRLKEVPDFALGRQTENIDIYIEEGRFLCAGSANDFEHHVSFVASELSIDIQRKIPLYLVHIPTGWGCSATGGCVRSDGVAFARPGSTYHELVHAVACQARLGAPPMLAEGVAVAYERLPNRLPNSPYGAPSTFSEVHHGSFNPYYSLAGHFIRWLHDDLGPDAFRDLYRTVNYTDGIWSAIEAAYGMTAEADYLANAPAMWVPHRQCADLPLLEPDGDTWTFHTNMDCEDLATFGPYERESQPAQASWAPYSMYQSFLIDVEAPGTYRFDIPDSDTTVFLERCLDEHPATKAEIKTEWVRDFVWSGAVPYGIAEIAHPGLWRVDVLYPHGPPSDVSLTIAPDPG